MLVCLLGVKGNKEGVFIFSGILIYKKKRSILTYVLPMMSTRGREWIMWRSFVQRSRFLVFLLPLLLFVICAALLAPVVQLVALFITVPLALFGFSLLFPPASSRSRTTRRIEPTNTVLPTVPQSLAGVMAMGDAAFERFAAALVLALGHGHRFHKMTGQSGDRGIDALLLNMYQQRVIVQAKLWGSDNTVGGPDIRGFSGALLQGKAVYGYFVTTSRFTLEAKIAITQVGNIRTLNGQQIEHMLHTRAREIALALSDIDIHSREA